MTDHLLPPAYVVRREVMFSLCPHGGGSDPARSGLGTPPGQIRMGVPPPRQVVPPARDGVPLGQVMLGHVMPGGTPLAVSH